MAEARSARPADAPAIGQVAVRAWQVAYRGLMPDAYLDGLSAAERGAAWQRGITSPRDRSAILVAEREGTVAGFAALGAAREDSDAAAAGELYALNVDPEHWGAGVGRALLDPVHSALTELGFSEAVLWVHPQNRRARRFYESAGWAHDQAEREAEVWGIVVPEVRYRRSLTSPGSSAP